MISSVIIVNGVVLSGTVRKPGVIRLWQRYIVSVGFKFIMIIGKLTWNWFYHDILFTHYQKESITNFSEKVRNVITCWHGLSDIHLICLDDCRHDAAQARTVGGRTKEVRTGSKREGGNDGDDREDKCISRVERRERRESYGVQSERIEKWETAKSRDKCKNKEAHRWEAASTCNLRIPRSKQTLQLAR